MAKRKNSNLLALAVLSLLAERPMHPYEVSAVMRQRELSAVVKLNYGTLYSVIESLQREGLIAPVETQREGRYPERTIYATTEAGQNELIDWLRSLLRTPVAEYSPFAAALAFLGNLSPTEAATLLLEHAQHLQEQMSSTRSTLQKGLELEVDRLFLVEDEYALILLQARYTFVQQLLREINEGTLTETSNGQLRWKIRRPDLALLSEGQEMEQQQTDTASS
ncbi:MAG TPA: PadR family transcriptional regulator [Ktedonobacteraceae bacterium]|nr:PadR family transcriptional regulator [Ktedonobacteraceae bacterium]